MQCCLQAGLFAGLGKYLLSVTILCRPDGGEGHSEYCHDPLLDFVAKFMLKLHCLSYPDQVFPPQKCEHKLITFW